MPAAAAGSVLNPSSASRALVRGNIRELFHVGQSCHTGACGTEPLRQRAPRDAGSAVVASSECWVKLAAAIGGKRLRRGSENPVRVKAPSRSCQGGRPVTLLAHEISFRVNGETGRGLWAPTVWDSGFSHRFSMIMQLTPGEEERGPPPGCWACGHPVSLSSFGTSPRPERASKAPYQEPGSRVATRPPALANTWLPVTCHLRLSLRGRSPTHKPALTTPAPHGLRDPASGQAPRKPPQKPLAD